MVMAIEYIHVYQIEVEAVTFAAAPGHFKKSRGLPTFLDRATIVDGLGLH